MTDDNEADKAMTQGGVELSAPNEQTSAAPPFPDQSATKRPQRDPTNTLAACDRILILGEPGRGRRRSRENSPLLFMCPT